MRMPEAPSQPPSTDPTPTARPRPTRVLNVVQPPPGLRYDLTRIPLLRKLLYKRWFQFMLILPNQAVFWLVIVAGIVGIQVAPGSNIATALTWYLWFCAVFVLMAGIGRGWCAMCPFGGAAEWTQHLSLFKKKNIRLGLGLRYPEKLARFGILPSVALFLALTFVEEFYNIAGPGKPIYTTFLVLFIITLAGSAFLIFERRTFCRYYCPLTALIGTVGQMGSVAGFRARDRDRCLTCETKECMRGSEHGYGCPWYEYPGQASSNFGCGLCSECYKNCPNDNIGLFVQPPLTSLYSGVLKRMDVAVGVTMLAGLVWFQQINALGWYGKLDDAMNGVLHWSGYPDPVTYLGICLLPLPVMYGLSRVGAMTSRVRSGGTPAWQRLFMDWSYTVIPLVGMDYLARQLPKFFNHVLRLTSVISDPFGVGWNLFGTARNPLANRALLSTSGVVTAQIIVAMIGLIATIYAAAQIRRHTADYAQLPRWSRLAQVAMLILIIGAIAVFQIWMYITMQAAE